MYDVGWQKALVVRDKQGGLRNRRGKKIIRKKQEADGGKEEKRRETVVYVVSESDRRKKTRGRGGGKKMNERGTVPLARRGRGHCAKTFDFGDTAVVGRRRNGNAMNRNYFYPSRGAGPSDKTSFENWPYRVGN